MKNAFDTQMITLETRPPRAVDSSARDALADYAELFSRLSRRYYRKSQLGSVSKNDFLRHYGITGRQFNAIKVSVEGMIDSQLSNMPNYAAQYQAKAEGLARRIRVKKAQASKTRSKERADKLWSAVKNMEGRCQSLMAKADEMKGRIERKSTAICFGSRRLFNAQHHLSDNGFNSLSEWRAEWQKARSSQFFVLGSSDESGGNQGCTLIDQGDGKYTLRVRLPNELTEKHGQYVYLTDILFPYRSEVIEAAVLANQDRRERQAEYRRLKKAGETDQSESQYLAGTGQALSYRFVRDNKGWRVLVSTSMKRPMPVADTAKGVIGIDFNADHLGIAELNRAGHKVHLDSLPLVDCQATSRQNRTQMEALAIEVVRRAKEAAKPIVVEKLNFKGKKAGLQKGETGQQQYHRMLSRLSHKLFRDALKMQAFRNDVAIIEVNPAYTSLIGRLKYGRETGFDTHQAAAWVIGRRGMGKKDRLPIRCSVRPATVTRTFTAPEDAVKDEPRELKRLARSFSQWCRTEWGIWRIRQKNWRMSQDLDLPDFL